MDKNLKQKSKAKK
jgi:hypothetical protein